MLDIAFYTAVTPYARAIRRINLSGENFKVGQFAGQAQAKDRRAIVRYFVAWFRNFCPGPLLDLRVFENKN